MVSVAEVVAEACDVVDGQLDETFERCRVAVLRGKEYAGDVVHGGVGGGVWVGEDRREVSRRRWNFTG